MKKRILIPLFLSLGALTGCLNQPKSPQSNGKTKDDYDLTNNVDVILYYGESYSNEDLSFCIKNKSDGIVGPHGTLFEITSKKYALQSYDVVEAYVCDINGENKEYTISSPITYKFGESNDGHYTVSCSVADLYYKIQGKELCVVTQDFNFIYHCWEQPSRYKETQKEEEYGDLSANPVHDYHIDTAVNSNCDLENSGVFEVKRVSGKWIENTIKIECSKTTLELVSVYLSDSEDNNVIKLLDNPRRYIHTVSDSSSKFYIEFKDADLTYYENCNQKVKLHVVTTEETIIFRTWYVNNK